MKKILILTATLALIATTSFASGGDGTTGSCDFTTTGLSLHAGVTNSDGSLTAATASTALIGKSSTGVDVGWMTDPAGYALMTQHKSGTKAYGSSYDSTAIYQTTVDAAPGTPAYNSGDLTASDTTDFLTDFKAM